MILTELVIPAGNKGLSFKRKGAVVNVILLSAGSRSSAMRRLCQVLLTVISMVLVP